MTEEKFYKIIGKGKTFKKIHKNWYKCFRHFLLKYGHTEESVKSLFYDFEMSNWKALHKENTVYKDCTKESLIISFKGGCTYIRDRMSYDRLFRTHWLFRQAFKKELNIIRYPTLFKKKKCKKE